MRYTTEHTYEGMGEFLFRKLWAGDIEPDDEFRDGESGYGFAQFGRRVIVDQEGAAIEYTKHATVADACRQMEQLHDTRPPVEWDALICEDGGTYHVSIEGVSIGSEPVWDHAVVRLARAMVEWGCFPARSSRAAGRTPPAPAAPHELFCDDAEVVALTPDGAVCVLREVLSDERGRDIIVEPPHDAGGLVLAVLFGFCAVNERGNWHRIDDEVRECHDEGGDKMRADDREFTALEMLTDYECPECGEVVDGLTEDDAVDVLGGDDRGFLRCPNEWCDEELEMTAAAAAENLAWVIGRIQEER
jgi:hypothetical protein